MASNPSYNCFNATFRASLSVIPITLALFLTRLMSAGGSPRWKHGPIPNNSKPFFKLVVDVRGSPA